MKAYRQINLAPEKKLVWSIASMFCLLGLLSVLVPMQAYSTGWLKQSQWSDVNRNDNRPLLLAAFNQSVFQMTDSAISRPDTPSHHDPSNLKNHMSFQADILNQFALSILFSSRLHEQYRWEWNSEDSSIYPIPKKNSLSNYKKD